MPKLRAACAASVAMLASCSARRHVVDGGVGDDHRAAAAQGQRDADDVAAGLLVDHAMHVAVDARPVARHARDHRVGVAVRHHQRGEHVALVGDEARGNRA